MAKNTKSKQSKSRARSKASGKTPSCQHAARPAQAAPRPASKKRAFSETEFCRILDVLARSKGKRMSLDDLLKFVEWARETRQRGNVLSEVLAGRAVPYLVNGKIAFQVIPTPPKLPTPLESLQREFVRAQARNTRRPTRA